MISPMRDEPKLPEPPDNPDPIEWIGWKLFESAWPYRLKEVAPDTWKQVSYGGKLRLAIFNLGIRLAGYRKRVL